MNENICSSEKPLHSHWLCCTLFPLFINRMGIWLYFYKIRLCTEECWFWFRSQHERS